MRGSGQRRAAGGGSVRARWLAASAVLLIVTAAGCEDAALERPDAAVSRDGEAPEAAPLDGAVALEDAAGPRDGGGSETGPRAPVAPASPAAFEPSWLDVAAPDLAASTPAVSLPVPPELLPCPEGWTETTAFPGDPPTCEPFGAAPWSVCDPGEARFPGTPGCAPLGGDCPTTDRWPSDLPAAGVLYVDAAAAAPGDGSRATPFTTVGAALALATSGTVIAVAPGTYAETLALGRAGVTVRGACAARTTFTSSSVTIPVVRVTAPDVRVQDVTLQGGAQGAVVAGGGLTLEGVEVLRPADVGVHLQAGELVARRLRIRSPSTDGLLLTAGAATVTQLEVSDASWAFPVGRAAVRSVGVTVVAVLDQVTIRDCANDGVNVQDGMVTLGRADLTETTSTALLVPGGMLVAHDLVVRDTRTTSAERGFGLGVENDARAAVDRATFERNTDNGIYVVHMGSDLTLRNSVVRDTRRLAPAAAAAEGVQCYQGGRCLLEQVAVLRSEDAAVVATDAGTVMTLRDVIVRGAATGGRQQGIAAFFGSVLTIERVLVEDVLGPGVTLATNTRAGEVDHLSIRDNRGSSEGTEGLRVLGASVVLRQVSVERTAGPGLLVADYAFGGSTYQGSLDVTDARVAEPGREPGGDPAGVSVAEGGRLTARRLLVVGAPSAGLQAAGATAHATVVELGVLAGAGAPALAVGAGAGVEVTRAALRTSGGPAASVVGPGASLSLLDAEARGSTGPVAIDAEDALLTLQAIRLDRGAGAGVRLSGTLASGVLDDLAIEGRGGGPALWLRAGATAAAHRLSLDGEATVALVAQGGSTRLEATDVAVTQAGASGQGIVVLDGASLGGEAVTVAGSSSLGAGAFGSGSVLELTSARLAEIRAVAGGPAVGAGAFAGAALHLDTFAIAGAEECGLELGSGAALTVAAGRISGGAVGLCVLDATADLEALRAGLSFEDVGAEASTDAREPPAAPALP